MSTEVQKTIEIGTINVHGVQNMTAEAKANEHGAWVSLGAKNHEGRFCPRLTLFADSPSSLPHLRLIADAFNGRFE